MHANEPKFSAFDSANRRGNRPPHDWRHWKKHQVGGLLRQAGAGDLDLESWVRDALYDVACSRAYQGYFRRLLVRKLQHEKWPLDRCRAYARRLACGLDFDGALTLKDVDAHTGARRRPGPDDLHLAAPRDLAVPVLALDDAALGRCREALAAAPPLRGGK